MNGSALSTWAFRALILLLYLFLLAPILIVVVISFDSASSMSFPPEGFSLQWYEMVFANDVFIDGFKVSFVVATLVALLAVTIGLPASLALTRYKFPGSEAITTFFLSPLLIPAIVLGLALLLVLAPLGFKGTYVGLVLSHLGITLPYVIRTTSTSLVTMDQRCEEAARTLGASAMTTFFRVTLPLILPGVLAGGVIAFLISFDEAVISLFVVGPEATTLPVQIFRYVETRTDPQVAALSVLLVALSIVMVIVLERVMGLRKVLD